MLTIHHQLRGIPGDDAYRMACTVVQRLRGRSGIFRDLRATCRRGPIVVLSSRPGTYDGGTADYLAVTCDPVHGWRLDTRAGEGYGHPLGSAPSWTHRRPTHAERLSYVGAAWLRADGRLTLYRGRRQYTYPAARVVVYSPRH